MNLTETTNSPFRDTIDLSTSTAKPVRFPLTLRIPSWCENPRITVNGNPVSFSRSNYVILSRLWQNGDHVRLSFPMHLAIHRWPQNKNAISVERGPLTFSLKIGEKKVRDGGTDQWPAFALLPTTPWNY